jgi:uncharacterized membrane protein (DUF373 family)
MLKLEELRRDWRQLTLYDRFEQIVSRILLLFVSLIILYSLVLVAVELVRDFQLGPSFMGNEVLQDTFGSILTIVILLEFNHSIAVAMRTRTGAIQVRIVVLLAILVIVRKLILLDYKTVSLETLLGFGGLALALGVLYWLIGDRERRPHATDPAAR